MAAFCARRLSLWTGIAISLACAVSGRGDDSLRLYVFSMPGCRPCKQMEPEVDRLIEAGYPVTKVDCAANEAWANHFQITQTPTTVLVANRQVVARELGPQNYADLVKLFDAIGFRPGQNAALAAGNATVPSSDPATTSAPARPVSSHNAYTSNAASLRSAPQIAAHRASVRIRVDDPAGSSYATGTVIHQHGNDCLAITCGHVFRDSQGTGTITIDYGFADGQTKTTRGHLVKYDSNARDVGLIAFQADTPIEPVRIAPVSLPVQAGDRVFSFGCDHGADPSLRTTQIIRTAIYDGAKKYDIVTRPVDGRSGGGLFSAGGQLIGVCNAAAVDVDEGIYSSLENIYWQLEQANLAHLFQASQQPVARAPVEPQVHTPQVATMQPVSRENDDVEIIMVVRSKSNPAVAQTLSIAQPSSQLLDLVQALRSAEANNRRTAASR